MPANIYRLENGTRVPGCTTICGQLDKPALLDWVHKIGFDAALELLEEDYPLVYKDARTWQSVRDSAGDKGTDVHDMIMRFWKGEEVVMVGDIQTKCFGNFLEWLKTHETTPALIEEAMVSEKFKFGGQPDLYADINDKLVLLDIKTSKAIYENNWYQLAGYDILLREHGYRPQEYAILRLGQDGSFEYVVRTELKREKRIFKDLLDIYYQRKQ